MKLLVLAVASLATITAASPTGGIIGSSESGGPTDSGGIGPVARADSSDPVSSGSDSSGAQCKPGTYQCSKNAKGWNVCNTSSQWVYGGDCPPKTVCEFNTVNQSPYCIPPGYQLAGLS